MTAVESLSGDFVSKMEQKLGFSYLHYKNYQSADLSGASLEKLWASQKSLFAKRFNALNKQGSSGRNYRQISNLLRN